MTIGPPSDISLSKSQYSEQVVRKALYWLSEETQWILADEESSWRVTLVNGSVENIAALNRLLNDFCLREQLDHQTRGLRSKIIAAALQKLAGD